MTNKERFWESAIAEAVSGVGPPDQTAEILARLHGSAPARRRPSARVLSIGWRLAAAASILMVIGLGTGVLPWPWAETPVEPGPEATGFIASPDARWRLDDGVLYLEAGMVLLGRDAPVVARGESRLSALEGAALARAGGEPDGAEMQNIIRWLEQQKVEADMVKQAKQWFTGAALAVLMLNGSAVLDGQVIRAEADEGGESEIEWRVVTSLMDLEMLPQEAKHVEVRYRTTELLEFLHESPWIEGLRLRPPRESVAPSLANHQRATYSHIASLSKLKRLNYLDLRGLVWPGAQADPDENPEPDYSIFEGFENLKTLGVDLMHYGLEGHTDPQGRATERISRQVGYLSYRTDELKRLQGRGVRILIEEYLALGDTSEVADAVFALFPDAEELKASTIGDGAIPGLLKFKNLKRLTLQNANLSEISTGRIARSLELRELIYWGGTTIPHYHHFSRMNSLRVLEVTAPRVESVGGSRRKVYEEAFEKLSALDNLQELTIHQLVLDDLFETPKALAHLPAVESLAIVGEFRIGQVVAGLRHVKAREISFSRWSRMTRHDLQEIGQPVAEPASTLTRLTLLAGWGDITVIQGDTPPDLAEVMRAFVAHFPSLQELVIAFPDLTHHAVHPVTMERFTREARLWRALSLDGIKVTILNAPEE